MNRKQNGKRKRTTRKPQSAVTQAERKKLLLMRQATAAAASRTNATGSTKTRGPKPRQVTLPKADEIRRLGRDDDDDE